MRSRVPTILVPLVGAPALALALAACAAGAAGTPTVNATAGPASSSASGNGPAHPSITTPSARPSPSRTVVTTLTVTSTVGTPTAPPPTTTAAPPTTPPSTAPTTDLAGEVYGFVTAVDVAGSQITLDKIDWFTGDAARQACAQDGITDTDNNRCTGWYYRNNNPLLRTVPVAPGATISVLNGGTRAVPGNLGAVAADAAASPHSPWRLTVTDGAITSMEEIYLP